MAQYLSKDFELFTCKTPNFEILECDAYSKSVSILNIVLLKY